MAACVVRCHWCGEEFVAQRRHRQWCSEAHRKAATRALSANGRAVPEHEQVVVSEIAAGRLSPHDGILWVVTPEAMRRRYSHGVAA